MRVMPDWLEAAEQAVYTRFADNAEIRQIATGFGFTEGPVWHENSLLFSDVIRNRIVRYRRLPEGPEITTFRYPSGYPLDAPPLASPAVGANGLTLDPAGRLIACETGNRRVSRTEPDGAIVPVAERYQGKRLNSPNDVVARSDGAIYFTDPLLPGLADSGWQEVPFSGVYCARPDGTLTLLVDDFIVPNGLAFSPDERLLYVNDSRRQHIRVFGVRPDGTLDEGHVFASVAGTESGVADGMKVDRDGVVYCTGAGGIWMFQPDGRFLGRMRLPEQPSNLAWGGTDWRDLYITARSSVYHVTMAVAGVPVPPGR
ncbi:MAG: gluconolactonase [Dehalococcoidia bacterium]|jgi:sugar lactone lactonase YvrE|nr:MAG: gluconolactonase [Dehalococcoidia bacterium]